MTDERTNERTNGGKWKIGQCSVGPETAIGVNVDVIGGGNKPIDGARVWELGDCCGNKQSVRRKEEENEAQ